MNKSFFLILPVALLGMVVSVQADGPTPIMSYDAAQTAIERGKISCQTDDYIGSHLDKRTKCISTSAAARASKDSGAAHIEFLLTKEGLFKELCGTTPQCILISADGSSEAPVLNTSSNDVKTQDVAH